MRRLITSAGCATLFSLAVTAYAGQKAEGRPEAAAPLTLEATGLYRDFSTRLIDPGHLHFIPQYGLWTDGATKRRWMSLPGGSVIDGSDPDAWVFPVGTRFWKEFSLEGRRIETRFMELQATGKWLYATYEWSSDGSGASLAPVRGRGGAFPLPNGRSYAIPSVSDCGVCHRSNSTEVLGFGALQLSSDPDPGALHAGHVPVQGDGHSESIELDVLIERGLVVGLPSEIAEAPTRVEARTPIERTALGYLHGNCGHCHSAAGKLTDLNLVLSQSVSSPDFAAIASTVEKPLRKPPAGMPPDVVARIAPGDPDRSGLIHRMASRHAALQMPPLGTQLVDDEAVALLHRWISELPKTEEKTAPATPKEDYR